jgi:predicted ATP-binding protein involved in virulence
MYVRKLAVKDLRCFGSAELHFMTPDDTAEFETPNVTLLLGDNGTGKSSVMRGIALAVLSPVISLSGYAPANLIRRDATGEISEAGTVVDASLHADDGDRLPGRIGLGCTVRRVRDYETLDSFVTTPDGMHHRGSESIEELYDDNSPAFFLVGYGATRFVGSSEDPEAEFSSRRRRKGRYQRVSTLFEENVPLTPLASWLPALKQRDPGRASEVTNLLNRLLPRDTQLHSQTERGEHLFLSHGVTVPAGALSDGYRSYVGWVADLLYHMTNVAPPGEPLASLRGVVMVDEVDLHLHPDWQRQVVSTIAGTFPRLQFVLSTHSPIVAGTLRRENIYVLEREPEGTVAARQLDERIHGRTADEILASSYFNLHSSRAPEFVRELQQISQRAMAGDSRAALEYLQALSRERD